MSREDAYEALNCLDPSMPRELWVRVAFGAKDAGITEEEWLAWCERGGNFDRADAISTYRNAKPRAGGVTAATLFMMARDAGYKPETAARPGAGVRAAPRAPAQQQHAGGNGGDGAPAVAAPRAPAPGAQPEARAVDPAPVWNACRPVDVHGYLSRKRIGAHGCRVNAAGWLVVPFLDREKHLQTVQTISADGTKRFLAGARQKGSVAILGEPADAAVILVAEGFATAAALEEATGFPTLAAGSRVSIPEGARIARHFSPGARLVIAADRGDLSTPLAAARAVGGFLALPGPEDAADGFDFADWRLNGATDLEITARIERAAPVGVELEEQPAPDATPRAPAAKAVAKKPTSSAAILSAYYCDEKGRVVSNLSNVLAYLRTGAAGEIRRDIFTGVITWRGVPMSEAAYVNLTVAVQAAVVDGRSPFVKVAVPTVVDALTSVAEERSYNSCIEWLDTLPAWDGVTRLERFFADVAELEASDYLTGVGRYFWHGLVGRMVSPGLQVDSAVTLIGPQGIGKSSLARIVGGERYGEASLLHIGERDWCAQLRGKVLIEISELAGHTRAELESIKSVLTRTADEYRPAYARTSSIVPRGCVFMVTTNERDFLIDASGNRRYLPVQCTGALNLGQVRDMREQYFAEAYANVRDGLTPTWYQVSGALDVQAEHLARDPWLDVLDERLREQQSGELLASVANTAIYDALKIPAERQTGGVGRRIANVMRTLGYLRGSWRTDDGRKVRGYERESLLTSRNT